MAFNLAAKGCYESLVRGNLQGKRVKKPKKGMILVFTPEILEAITFSSIFSRFQIDNVNFKC